jgi:ribosomal protein S18 acetylase RimI-like enzyme
MNRKSPVVSLSPLDEERFGIRTARASDVLPETVPEVLEFCRENRVVLAACRCSVSEPLAAQELERAGFLLMDTLVYYARDLRRGEAAEEEEGSLVRPFRPGEEEAVRRVAADAFRGYVSHYHADPRLDPRKCDEVYPDWAFRTCVRGAADQVLVAESEGAVAGFASIRRNSPDEADVLLFAVDPAHQGRGIARALLLKTMEWCRSRRVSRLLYSTQITNQPAQKLLVRIGFEPAHAFYTFHKWFDGA